MKKTNLIIGGLTLALIAIIVLIRNLEVKSAEQEDDFLKIPEYEKEETTPTFNSTSIYDSASKPDSTYWYVILSSNNVMWHGTVSLGTPYFDFAEARRQFSGAGARGKSYFKFILQIDKESIKTFDEYDKIK